MGELLCAIEEEREPLNSARDNLRSLRLCQAALRSVRRSSRGRLSAGESGKDQPNPSSSPVISSPREETRWPRDALRGRRRRSGRFELDPGRAKRDDRPHYAIVDIGSNSVRLMVYDQLGRAPMPRFNEKSLSASRKGLPKPASSRRTAFAALSRPWAVSSHRRRDGRQPNRRRGDRGHASRR